jgi:hypothetical protein
VEQTEIAITDSMTTIENLFGSQQYVYVRLQYGIFIAEINVSAELNGEYCPSLPNPLSFLIAQLKNV